MRSILLVKTSSLGDVVHNLPLVSDLRRRWPNVAIDWVVEEAFADIPALHPGVRRVIPVAIRRWRRSLGQAQTWRQMRSFAGTLRSQYYDAIIDSQGLIKSAVITRLAQGLRCGFDAPAAREALAAHAYHAKYLIPRNAHAVERNRWLAAAAGDYSLEKMPLRYGITGGDAPAWAPQQAYVVLLTASSRADKCWPEAHWIALGQALAAQGLICALPAGSAAERSTAARIAAAIPHAAPMPAARIAELAALMQGAQAVIGVDTGLTHLAAALQVPVVALYTATDPALTGVFAGPQAVNLGHRGATPSAREVLDELASLQARIAHPNGRVCPV